MQEGFQNVSRCQHSNLKLKQSTHVPKFGNLALTALLLWELQIKGKILRGSLENSACIGSTELLLELLDLRTAHNGTMPSHGDRWGLRHGHGAGHRLCHGAGHRLCHGAGHRLRHGHGGCRSHGVSRGGRRGHCLCHSRGVAILGRSWYSVIITAAALQRQGRNEAQANGHESAQKLHNEDGWRWKFGQMLFRAQASFLWSPSSHDVHCQHMSALYLLVRWCSSFSIHNTL